MSDVLHCIDAGSSPKALARPAVDGEVGVLKVSAVTWRQFRPHENKALPSTFDITGIPTVRKGDLLLSRANTAELLASPVIAEQTYPNLILSDKTLRLVMREEIVDSRFLLYALRQKPARLFFRANATGTSGSMRNVSQATIRRCPIPLPPLAEQKRIAGILDAADALRARRREALAQLDTLLQSTFLDMFGDPVTNPMGWEVVAFTEVGQFISGGTPSKSRDDFWNGTVPWVSPKDMKRSFISDSIDTITETALNETSIKLIAEECILIVVRGMILAHTFPVALTTGKVTINQDMKAILPNSDLLPKYLLFAMKAQQREILAVVSSSAHGTKKFDKKAMEGVRVPIPPLDLQHGFADIVESIEQQKARMRCHLEELDTLFASLQSRAFNGEL